jgi:uncharacterized sulfatase
MNQMHTHNAIFIRTMLAVALWLTAFAPARAERPPNIVLIISDDQGWTDYGFMGDRTIRTPNLDKLAAQSLVYRRGYVPSPLCCPSLASLITGRYPHEHRITGNDPAPPEEAKAKAAGTTGREIINRRLDALPTIPRELAKAGYLSLQTGKWWQGEFTRGGFTHGMTQGSRHGDVGLDIGRKTMQPIDDFIASARKQDKPFFLWYAPMMPHSPHDPPARLLEKYRKVAPSPPVAAYWAMCEWFDETCGNLLGRLDELGIARDTIVVYVTDNGWLQSERGDNFAARSKTTPYEFGVRTPIMIRWPAKVTPGSSEALASSLDIMPTLLAAAGLKRPPGIEGVDLLDASAVARRKTIFGECYTVSTWDLDVPEKNLLWRTIIDGELKLIVPCTADGVPLEKIPQDRYITPAMREQLASAQVELFDLANDPREEHNLAARRPNAVAALRAKLNAWWTPRYGDGAPKD